jgi:hypothetical protein
VDRAGITADLEAIAAAGIGGVEITPIYGARGAEPRYIDFLSPRWIEMLEHTTREARRLGLGVDMATGTGWPFGGPEVSAADGSSKLTFVDGRLGGVPTQMKVKRAAPGGEGLVLDPYSTDALSRYLAPFDRLPRDGVRAQFHDSFEYYEASWTAGLPAKFQELNGYDIQSFADAIAGRKEVDADTLARVKGDYRRTLARMHLDYVNHWVAWSHARGSMARNQAHGAPGNLLDLYAAADIPETESFGMTRFPIPGLRAAPDDVNEDPDPAVNLIGRFASSAAHVSGRPLASSESLTWLRENFRESPAAAKPQLDRLFTAGINHIFYHGTVYSPPDAPWPGWYFYAASQINPRNPLWKDLGAMNAYVTRVQSVLRAGGSRSRIAIYWPFDDLVDDAAGGMRQLGMHDNQWLVDSSAGKLALRVAEAGWAFDFISDAQLMALEPNRYFVIIVPKLQRIDEKTLARLRGMNNGDSMVLFEAKPEDVPGLADLDARRAQFNVALPHADQVAPDILARLQRVWCCREAASAAGFRWIRREREDGTDYFLVNGSASRFDGWLGLQAWVRNALLLDPLDGDFGRAAVRRHKTSLDVYLQLEPGQSMIVRTYSNQAPRARPWRYVEAAGEGAPLAGPWQLTFLEGGPELPAPATLATAASWTTLADPRAQSFSGTARYRATFDAPATQADEWLLDLGDVRETARVRVNGRDLGVAWSLPFKLRLGALKPAGNVLEIDVTNLPANRVRDLDRRKVEWKIMRDINLASLRYGKLDASGWAVEPSGLNGPVRLVPLRVIEPK